MQGLVAADDPDLRQSLSDLSRLASAAMALPDMLTNIAEFAVQAIPGADGAGLTLMEHDRPDTVVANADFVGEIDAIQYDLGEGPSLTAVAEGRTVRSGLLSTAPAWPRFGPRSERLGVHSALSLPLLVGASVIGSLNVYARAADAFDERAEELGELFAVPASISVQNAQTLSQATRLAAQLQTALTSRATIDQAMGIVMSRSGCTADEAFHKLRQISQADNIRLSLVARSILDQAVQRVRARATSEAQETRSLQRQT